MTTYRDEDGKEYIVTGTYGARKADVLATEARCLIDGNKLRVVFNRTFYPQKLGLTRVV